MLVDRGLLERTRRPGSRRWPASSTSCVRPSPRCGARCPRARPRSNAVASWSSPRCRRDHTGREPVDARGLRQADQVEAAVAIRGLPIRQLRDPVTSAAIGVAVGDVVERRGTGVGHDVVQAPELPDGGLDGRPDGVVVGRVPGQSHQAGRFADLLGERVEAVLATSGDRQPVAQVQQCPGRRRPHAAATAGDERDRGVRHASEAKVESGLYVSSPWRNDWLRSNRA